MAFFDFLKKIDINEGVRLCSETEGAVLLDVREADEYNNRHIPNAVNLPLSMIRTAEKTIPDKNTPLFVYCLSGARSGQAVAFLRRKGYSNARNIGGIQEWKKD